MSTILDYLFGKCFPCRGRRHLRDVTERQALSVAVAVVEIINFIIPPTCFEEYARRMPMDEYLNVSQYMFLYRYIVDVDRNIAPGPDFEKVSYLFLDGPTTYKLQGWVPTKPAPKPVPQAAMQSLIKESKVYSAAFPTRKSAYNWGVINTWSSNLALTCEDNLPVDLFLLQIPTAMRINYAYGGGFQHSIQDYQTCEKFTYDSEETEKIREAIRHVGFSTNVTSTLVTRDRSQRPKAAKGKRTRHQL